MEAGVEEGQDLLMQGVARSIALPTGEKPGEGFPACRTIPPPSLVAGRTLGAMAAWGNVGMAAILMLATLPGRTQGLGLITEPMPRDLPLDRVDYANVDVEMRVLTPVNMPVARAGTAPELQFLGTELRYASIHFVIFRGPAPFTRSRSPAARARIRRS